MTLTNTDDEQKHTVLHYSVTTILALRTTLVPEFQVCICLPMVHLEFGSSFVWTCDKAHPLKMTLLFFWAELWFCYFLAQKTGHSSVAAAGFFQSCLLVASEEGH